MGGPYIESMNAERGDTPRHPIRVVARRTGLTPALLRAWEKRYGVVEPSRSEGGQRLYSDDDVERLSLLHRAVDEGRSISQVAPLTSNELRDLVEEDRIERVAPPTPEPLEALSARAVLEQAKKAVREMDGIGLERILTRGAMAMSVPILIDDILSPLLQGIGTSWSKGELGPAHEHVASVVVRRFLEWLLSTMLAGEGAPVLVSATPAGERHELGALLSAVTAAGEGWTAVYLGPDLPAAEIAAAAKRLEARIVALSLVDPALGAAFSDEIRDLRGALSGRIRLVVGGPPGILAPLKAEVQDVEFLDSLGALRGTLRRGLSKY